MSSSAKSIADRLREHELVTQRTLTPLEGLFRDEPVPLEVFVTDRGYLNNPPLSPVQFEAVRYLEQIYLPETYTLMAEGFGSQWEPVRFVNLGVLQWGKGSGKDHVCQILDARWIYLLLCLHSPQRYFELASQSKIHTLNVAASQTQANRVFFAPFRDLIKRSRCFRGSYEARQGDEPGKFEIEFDKGLVAISGHSGSSTQEGLNLIAGIADEISAFPTDDEVKARAQTSGGREPDKTAGGVIRLMKTSSRSRFPRNFKNVYISYPRFDGDAIQQLTVMARQDNERRGAESKWYVDGPRATWEVNPRIKSKADFADDYEPPPQGDPAMAEAMYECRPGKATNRAFRNDAAIASAFAQKITPPIVVDYFWGKDEQPEHTDEPDARDEWQPVYSFTNLFPMQGAAYAIHADMATNQDRAGVAMCHVRNWKAAEWPTPGGEQMELRPIVKLDFVMAWEADVSAEPGPREVQLRWLRKLVWKLITKGFFIYRVSMDGWQSTDSLQIFESRGIESEKVSCDVPQTPVWKTLQDVMYDGRLEGYHDELLIKEIQGLRLLPNKKIDHPPGGSKDLADAVAGAVHGALLAGGTEGDEPQRADEGSADMFTMQPPKTSLMPESMGDDISLERIDLGPPDWA